MTPDNGDDLEPTIFSATLTPHRSLNRVGFLVLMLLFGGVSFVTGMLRPTETTSTASRAQNPPDRRRRRGT